MSFRSRRKSSGHGSSFLSTRRRSSATQRELEQHLLIQKRQRLPDWFTGLLMLVGPALLLLFSVKMLDISVNDSLSLSGPLLVLLLTQIQLFFLWHLPANELIQLSEEGEPLRHRATAFESCLLICLLYLLGALLELYPGQLVFIHWPSILASVCLLCLLLLLLIFLCVPFPEEQRNNGNSLVSQLFYGRHLQPVFLNVDIKAFVTCRLALTLWALYLLSALFEHRQRFPHGQPSLPLLTTSSLQLIYVLRRQWFEQLHTGLDNRNDRAGFYRLWVVLAFLPSLYLLPVTIGTQRDEPERPFFVYFFLFVLGISAQWLNLVIDLQRHNFREKGGQLKMGGKDPFYICAKFRRENGESCTALLLGSGYWALCRHPNYASEFCTFLCWTLPWTDPIAYLPLMTLGTLLWLRMRKDELRCSIKYGQFWSQHCQKVPHLLLPGIY